MHRARPDCGVNHEARRRRKGCWLQTLRRGSRGRAPRWEIPRRIATDCATDWSTERSLSSVRRIVQSSAQWLLCSYLVWLHHSSDEPRVWPSMLGLRRGRHAARHEPRLERAADQADRATRNRRASIAAEHAQGVVVYHKASSQPLARRGIADPRSQTPNWFIVRNHHQNITILASLEFPFYYQKRVGEANEFLVRVWKGEENLVEYYWLPPRHRC